MPRTVLIADPDPRASVAFATALRNTDFAVAGNAANGRELLDAVFRVGPWAVAVDLSLPDHPQAPNVGWVATAWHLREIAPFVQVMITFNADQLGLVPASLGGGARAFAEKPYLKEEILAALTHLTTDLPRAPFFARSRRVPRPLALRYRLTASGQTAVTRVGLVRNVSETGVSVAVSEPLPHRAVLFTDIELPDRSVVRSRGQVVREIRSPRNPGVYEYGLALFDLDATQRARLRDFIRRALAGDPALAGDTTRYAPELRASVAAAVERQI